MKARILTAGVMLFFTAPLLAETGTHPQASAVTPSARAAVNALNQKEEAACRNMDNAASGALWAEDGVDLIQGLAPMVGRTAIVKWYASLQPQLHGAKLEYCKVDWREIKIQGDWAWEWAITRQKIDFPPPQKSFEGNGKMLLLLKRQPSGEWQIELESWSGNPAPEEKKK